MRDDEPFIPYRYAEFLKQGDDEYRSKFLLGTWENTNDCVFSREQVGKLLEAGRISKDKAEYLLYLRYEVRRGNKVVVDKDRCYVDLDEIRHYLTLL